MADYNSSLPVRTENNGDVVVKLGDGTTPSQFAAVDASGRLLSRITDTAGNSLTSTSNALNVNITNALTTGVADKTAFTYGTSVQQVVGGVFQDTAPTLTSGTQGAVRLTTNRAFHVNLRDAAGNEKLGSSTSANSIPVVIASDQGAVPVSQSGTWTVQPGNTANTTAWLVKDVADGSVGAGTAGTFSALAGLVFNTAAPTLTTGQQAALQGDSSANLKVTLATALPTGANVIGAVTQSAGPWTVTGSGTAGTPATGVVTIQGISGGTAIPVSGTVTATNPSVSTTGSAPPASATYIGGSVTTAAPTYTTGQMSALSLTTAGLLRVDGSGTTQTITGTVAATQSGAWTVNQGTANTNANGWFTRLTDGTNNVAVKAASTAAATTDPSLVVALSPNSPIPTGTNNIGNVGLLVGGSANSITNPLYIEDVGTAGTPINNYQTSASLAAAATANLDYTVTAAKTFYTQQIWATGSGKIKVVVAYETAAASGTYTTFWVGFNSTSDTNILIPVPVNKTQVAGAKVRISITNLDKQSQDVYATLSGTEQ